MPGTDDASELLRYYGSKCEQHLARVDLSHRLAISGLHFPRIANSDVQTLIGLAFPHTEANGNETKLERGLHETHLVALKADFELFLNRVLTVLWRTHFAALGLSASRDREISTRDLADAALLETDIRDIVIQLVVPTHGLKELIDALKEATDIDLRRGITESEYAAWCQIEVAFQIRHLVEHRDSKVDPAFRKSVQKFWHKSSWGNRSSLPEGGQKISIADSDVHQTYESMRDTSRRVTETIVQWHFQQPMATVHNASSQG